MGDIDRIIQQALDCKSNLKLANLEYSKALDFFWQGINQLFELIKMQSEPELSRTKSLINNLLVQAEQCKAQLQPVPKRDPIKKLFQPVQTDYIIPNVPSTAIPQKKVQKTSNNDDHSDEPLEAMIENEIIDISQSMNWDDIAGLENAKEMLREAVILPSQFPLIFVGIRAPPKGILLFGPPGTGKTLLAKALASQSSACFFSISASTLTSRFVIFI